MPTYTGYLVETFVTLLGVCALSVLVLWAARRVGVGRASGSIELYGHLPLEGRRAIYLVRVGAQVFIVGVGEGGFTKLGEMPADELPAEATAARRRPFAEALARAIAGRSRPRESLQGASADAMRGAPPPDDGRRSHQPATEHD